MGKLTGLCLLYRISKRGSYKGLHLPTLPHSVSWHHRHSSHCYSSRVAPILLVRQSFHSCCFKGRDLGTEDIQLQSRMPKARLKGIRQNEVVHRNKNEPVSSPRLRLFITSIKYLLYCQSWDCIQKDGGENGKNVNAGVRWHPDASASCVI